jgi:hypothetical protein
MPAGGEVGHDAGPVTRRGDVTVAGPGLFATTLCVDLGKSTELHALQGLDGRLLLGGQAGGILCQ